MSAQPFPISIFPDGVHSREIQVDRALEDASISVCFLLESVAAYYEARLEPYSGTKDGYNATGKLRSGWRRREREEQSWGLQSSEWIITRGPLPNGAQALVTARRSPPLSSGGTVSPIFLAKQSAMDEKKQADLDRIAKEKRDKDKEALRKNQMQEALMIKNTTKPPPVK